MLMMASDKSQGYDMKKIKLVSFSMHGFHQGCSVIEDLINNDTPDIILLHRSIG